MAPINDAPTPDRSALAKARPPAVRMPPRTAGRTKWFVVVTDPQCRTLPATPRRRPEPLCGVGGNGIPAESRNFADPRPGTQTTQLAWVTHTAQPQWRGSVEGRFGAAKSWPVMKEIDGEY